MKKILVNRLLIINVLLTLAVFFLVLKSLPWPPVTKEKNNQAAINLPAITNLPFNPPPKPQSPLRPPAVYAQSIILLDRDSAYPLYEKNSHLLVPIASTTKIMTAIIVLEDYDLDKVITVPKEAVQIIGSDIQLRWDERLTVRSLLEATLIASGNDAAYALAMDGQTVEQFVQKMNERAELMGLKDTTFQDPAGLDDSGRSTPFDLAMLASYALRNATFRQIIATTEKDIVSADGQFTHHLKNSNRLVNEYNYPGALGIKTGFTPEAGHSLVSAAQRNGHTLIGIVLNTNESTITASANESRKLLDWGFNNWQW